MFALKKTKALTRRPFGTDGKELDPFGFDFAPTERLTTPPKPPKNFPRTMADPFVDAFNARENTQYR